MLVDTVRNTLGFASEAQPTGFVNLTELPVFASTSVAFFRFNGPASRIKRIAPRLHTRAAVAARASAWLMQGLWLYGLPAYSSELNPIEILRKYAKPFWRRFVAWQPASLHEEVDQLPRGYVSNFQISFK